MKELFSIFELTETIVNDILQSTYEAHRHDYEELIIINEGTADHFIDFKLDQIKAPSILYIAGGKTHKFIPAADLRGWVIRYKTELIPDSPFHFYSRFRDFTNIHIPSDDIRFRLTFLCLIMQVEHEQVRPDLTLLRHLLNAFITMVDVEQQRSLPLQDDAQHSRMNIFNFFLQTLEKNFKRDEDVGFYAGQVNMSVRNLNLISQAVFNQSISEIIETRKLMEAKNLLVSSDKTIAEIGFELGYNEKSYFSRVFRKSIGLTPSEFRQRMKAIIG